MVAAGVGHQLEDAEQKALLRPMESPSNPLGSTEILEAPVASIDKIYQQLTGTASRKQSAKDLKDIISSIARQFRSSTTSTTTTGELKIVAPALNALRKEEWRDGMLVRFRGMVQDMFESVGTIHNSFARVT